jgi:hypothetical protein
MSLLLHLLLHVRLVGQLAGDLEVQQLLLGSKLGPCGGNLIVLSIATTR